MPANQPGEYQPVSWSELFCQCFPLRNKKKPSPANQDIEMQNMSNPVVPEHVVRANHPDNVRRPPLYTSWWLRDDAPSPPPTHTARPGRSTPTAGPSGPRQPYTPPQNYRRDLRIAPNTPDMFVHDSDSSPDFPSLGTPQWNDLTRILWTDNPSITSSQNSRRIPTPSSIYSEHTSMAPFPATSTVFSASQYTMSGALPARRSPSSAYSSSQPSQHLPNPSSIFSSNPSVNIADLDHGATAASSARPPPSASIRPSGPQYIPQSSPTRESYAGLLAVQDAIDYRRSLQRAGLQPPSPTNVFNFSPPTPHVTPVRNSYARVLQIQAEIDQRRALQREGSQPASPTAGDAQPPSPTGSVGSVDSIDFFTGGATSADFGVRPTRPARTAGTSLYIA